MAKILPKLFAIVVALLAIALAPLSALAANKSIAVVVEGPNADAVRTKITNALPKNLDVADTAAFTAEVKKAGYKGALTSTIDKPKQRDKMLKAVRKAEAAAHVDALLLGKSRKAKGGSEVYLIYVDQVEGDLAVDEAVPLTDGPDTDAIKKVIASPIEQLAPPEKPKPAPVAEKPANEEPPATEEKKEGEEEKPPSTGRPAHKVATELFEVRAGLDLGSRSFDYSDPLPADADLLRKYSNSPTGMIALGLDLYPAAGTSVKVLKDLGVQFDFARALALSSGLESGGGASISTGYNRILLALRGRFRVSDENGPVVGARVGFSNLSFTFSNPPAELADSLADVSYSSLLFGVDGRLPFLDRLALNVGFDYLAPLSTGTLYSRFTKASVGGMDLRAGLGVAIVAGIEGRFVFEYDRYFSTFHPNPGDAYVAGGALDNFILLNFGLAYVY